MADNEPTLTDQTLPKTTLVIREIKCCSECGRRFSEDAMFCPFDGTRLTMTTWDPSSDPLIGSTVDKRYEVESVLGEGGMGKVYKVRHTSLDRPFAMKVLRRDLAKDAELSQRFTTEARATAAVRHPNIVSISDFGRLDDETPFFVMELLSGHTLSELIKAGGPIQPGRAVRVIRQIASALGAAHKAGVIHRDLKPENVFLVGPATTGPFGDVRIVDFGAARILGTSRLTKTGIVFGTPHYMSPEQAGGQEIDHRTDIYALGIIMYEMFTGKVPFEADTYMGVLTQHMFVMPQRPSRAYPPAANALGALEQITLRALEKKPAERYQTMEDLLKDVDAVSQVTSDGSVAVLLELDRPSRAPKRPPQHRVVDELEPPTLEEMRMAVDAAHVQGDVQLWKWIGGGAAVGALVVLAAALIQRSASPPPRVVASTMPSTKMPIAVTTLDGVPAPPPATEAKKRVLVSAMPVAAQLFQGASLVGTTPVEVALDPSSLPVRYTLRAEGYADQELVVDEGTGDETKVELRRVSRPFRARPAQPAPDDVGDPFLSKRH